jgi:hypothetical protein
MLARRERATQSGQVGQKLPGESLEVGNCHSVTQFAIIQCVAGLQQGIESIYNLQSDRFVCLMTRDIQPEILFSEVRCSAERTQVSQRGLRFILSGVKILHRLALRGVSIPDLLSRS